MLMTVCSRQQQPVTHHSDARDDVGGSQVLEAGSDSHSDSSADTVEEGHTRHPHPAAAANGSFDGRKQGTVKAANFAFVKFHMKVSQRKFVD